MLSSLAYAQCSTLPVEAKGLANQILDWASGDGVEISPMKLQKILYFCHADYLVQFATRLIKQDFEAWNYGPVIPSIYSEFKNVRKGPIVSRALVFDPISASRRVATCQMPPLDQERVHSLYSFYRHMSAEHLSDLSHESGGPWRQARSLFANGLNMDRRMTADMIQHSHRLPHE